MREHLIKDEIVFRGGVNNKKSWLSKDIFPGRAMSVLKMRTWLLGILGFLIASLMIINNFMSSPFTTNHLANITIQDNFIESDTRRNVPELRPVAGYLIHTPGCRIAAFDPLDTVAKRFMEKAKPIICEFGTQLPLVESNETAVFINPRAVNLYYNSSEAVNCSWQAFERKKNHDNFVKYHNETYKFENASRVSAEFVKVECYKSGKRIYRDYHFFVPQKPLVEERCRIAKKKRLERRKTNERDLNILILGLDAVSRRNFHRMMPKTARTLASLGAAEMLGYTKVGDNTYPNVVPVLSGLSDKELQAHCWSNPEKPFDDCPFLWKNFSQAGYRTVLAEDACAMTTFNYLKPGFSVQPTDYYFRPYCTATEGDIGNTHQLNADLCVGTRKTFENLLNYTRKITKALDSSLYFAFFWEASLTHDFFNYPQLGDEAYSNFLNHLKDENLLNNTLLVVMSDHGMRWGDFRQTYEGRVEGSLPFVFFTFPDWWKKKFPLAWANLQRNTVSLSTPYDLHETLADLLAPERILDDSIRKRSLAIDASAGPRGISYFLPISDHRTCSIAGIPGHWCMCHESSNISLTEPAVENATRFILDELNRMVAKYPRCTPLALKRILDAKVWTGREEEKQSTPWTDYTVSIETLPGDAIFEASVRRGGNDENSLVGSIGRLNAYGNQSACIDDSMMRLYCYCYK